MFSFGILAITMKILFVCSVNKQRSKTAEDYFAEKYQAYKFLSAGTNLRICRKEGIINLDIPNVFKYYDKELIRMLEDKLNFS